MEASRVNAIGVAASVRRRLAIVIVFCALLLATLLSPQSTGLIAAEQEDEEQNIDLRPKFSGRNRKPFLPPGIRKVDHWIETPRFLKTQYERGFMGAAVWRRIREIQEKNNCTWDIRKLVRHDIKNIAGANANRRTPSLKKMIDTMTPPYELMANAIKALEDSSLEMLFGRVHPFMRLEEQPNDVQCLELIQRTQGVSRGYPAVSVLTYMRRHFLPRTRAHYNAAMLSAAVSGNPESVEHLFEWIEDEGLEIDSFARSALVLAIGNQLRDSSPEDEDRASIEANLARAWDMITAVGGTPTAEAYTGMLCAFAARSRDAVTTEEAKEQVQQADQLRASLIAAGVEETATMRANLRDVLAPAGFPLRIEAMMSSLDAKEFEQDDWREGERWYIALILAYFKAGDGKSCLSTWRRAPPMLRASTAVCNAALRALASFGMIDEMMKFFKSMHKLEDVEHALSGARTLGKQLEVLSNYDRELLAKGAKGKKTFGVRDSTSYSLVVRGCVRNGLALVAELLLKEMNELHMTTPQALRMEVDVALRKFRDDLSLLPRKAIELRDRNLPEKKPSRQKVKDGYSDDEDDDGDAEEDVDMDEDHGADESSIAPQLDPSAAAAKWMIEETAQLLTGRSQEAFIQFVKAPTEENAWQGFEGLDLEGIFSKLKMMVEDMWNEGHLRRPEADFVKWRLLLSSRKVEEELILEEIMEKKFEEEGGAAGLAWTRDLPKGPEEPWASSARLEELTNKHEKQLPKNLGKVAKARRYRGTRKKGRKTMRKVLKKRR